MIRKLQIPITFVESIRKFIQANDNWHVSDKMQVLRIPNNLFGSQFIELIQKFKGRVEVFRFKPNSVYGWHIDRSRMSAINVLINNTHSHVLFNPGKTHSINLDVVELKYENNAGYLMDVQIPHCVINLEGERDVLTIGFPEASYAEVSRYLDENKI